MGQILDSYTVYCDLVIADLDGRILANGRPRERRLGGRDVGDSAWYRAALETRDGTQFGFESVHASPLLGGQRALVYSCAIREGGGVRGPVHGVLGILFDWAGLGDTIVRRTPLSAEEWQSARACIVDAEGIVLADTAGAPGAKPQRLDFAGRAELFRGPRGAITTRLHGRPVRIAHAASPGYETYRTGWHSLLVRELGE